MRTIHPELATRLESGATTLCTCWVLTRGDGAVLGFTDHDAPVEIDGVSCMPGSSLGTAAQEAQIGLAPGGTEVEGALTADAIRAEDVALGRYDGAGLERWIVDWMAPHLRHLAFRGVLGEIVREGDAFRAEVLGLSAALNRPVGRVFQRRCDARLGDGRCGVDPAAPGLRASGAVEAEGPLGLRVSGLDGFAAGWFSNGALLWTGGSHAGLGAVVLGHRVEQGAHWLDLADGAAAGDAFTVTAGCDGTLAQCAGRFSNVLNFRGFPQMPGEDWALAPYPAPGGLHDGGVNG